jgi:pSer/pThr/pTyr-binding forkhead associated (FHA) protein/S1-C subfamily serine protease
VTVELRILTGARAGARARFEHSTITIGRDPASDLRLDADRDLDVSARHAELRAVDGAWTLADLGSTNGTFVNGERVDGERRLRAGDVVSLGEAGPRIEVLLDGVGEDAEAATAAPRPRRNTAERIADAVHAETASLKRMYAHALGAIVVIGGVAVLLWQQRASTRERELLALIERSDSASGPLVRTILAMRARDSQFSRRLAERDSALAQEIARGRRLMRASGTSPRAVAELSERVAEESRLRQAILRIDYPRVHDLNDPAVALVVSDLDGTYVAGTAFAVSAQGALVTNRHVVRAASGAPPRRICVLLANTTAWRDARLTRASDDDDLALLQIDSGPPVPVVAGVSRLALGTRVGSPVATIGFPHAVDAPMEGAGLAVRARSTTTAGTVSKRITDVLQIDAYAGKGSSGSPVLDARGYVVGVVYGGEAESHGRIVYAVPAERLAAFLSSAGVTSILR